MNKIPIYIVAGWSPDFDGSHLFPFTDESNRDGFIEDIKARDSRVTWATTEDTVDEDLVLTETAS